MTPEQITHVVRHTLFVALELAAPFLILALLIGLLIAVFQSLSHIQEMTLSFVPKMLIVGLSVAIFFPWMLKIMTKFTSNLWIHQWEKVTDFVTYVLR
ncbi:MAG: flagellar type III secretion system protein FliQ [Chlamydiales bacterium]|nr:flagellar type III secretion system protein FliQ [Chlamydiales bacterium]